MKNTEASLNGNDLRYKNNLFKFKKYEKQAASFVFSTSECYASVSFSSIKYEIMKPIKISHRNEEHKAAKENKTTSLKSKKVKSKSEEKSSLKSKVQQLSGPEGVNKRQRKEFFIKAHFLVFAA
jgi:hypothetical protein